MRCGPVLKNITRAHCLIECQTTRNFQQNTVAPENGEIFLKKVLCVCVRFWPLLNLIDVGSHLNFLVYSQFQTAVP